MKTIRAVPLILAGGLLAVAACNPTATAPVATTNTPSVYNDSTLTADVASTSGDEVATSVETMIASEQTAALPGSALNLGGPSTDNSLSYARTRTCYDAAAVVVAGCKPLDSVRVIVTHVAFDGSRSFSNSTTGGDSRSWSGAVHRVLDDTLTRNFNTATPPVETSRTHSATGTAHDSTSFTADTIKRFEYEAAHDRINAVTWDLPHATNPFPVSGSIVRADTIHAVFTKGSVTQTKDVVRTVEVDFPADNQGNVVLKIDGKTCTLNLVTHAVVNCH